MNAQALTKALGGRWCGSYGMARCPAHDDRSPSLAIRAGDRRVLLYCHAGCEQDQILAVLKARGLWGASGRSDASETAEPTPSREDEARERTEAARMIWSQASRCARLPYLVRRGITIPVPPSLRLHPELKHGPSGQVLAAMVAAVQAAGRRIVAVQRTFLTRDRSAKADVVPPKMTLGPTAGGAVRLAPVTDTVALVEGIEDALSVIQMDGTPTWAVLGTSGFKAFEPPQGLRRVILAPDNDEAGQAVIEPAGNRLADMGLNVDVARPPFGCGDWNAALEIFEERAAIAEFDHGMARRHAEESVLEAAQ
jgi:hypothetical protein